MAKFDIYQAVTDRILEMLDRGTVPWRMPITRGNSQEGLPRNLVSGRAYRGVNVFLLAVTAWIQGYESAYWLTYRQASQQGGQVRRGEKSSLVVFWKRHAVEDKETGKDKLVPVIRYYNVFNAQQCEGIKPPDAVEPGADAAPFVPIEEAERIVAGYPSPPSIEHVGGRAFYRPSEDRVRIPAPARFETPETYYATLFHELAHSTGHISRLDRGIDKAPAAFGSPDYSKEELVAEMGAAFLAATAGISSPTIEQSAAYIDGWRSKLKGDRKLVVQAAAAGQRAADHILGVTWDEADEENAGGSQPVVSTKSARASHAAPPRAVPETREVDPSRLARGHWSAGEDRTVGEGDISASYSADLIATNGRVRSPFNHHGGLWVCTGTQPSERGLLAEAYRLVDADGFGGATTYADKTRDSEAARHDPNGFYHAMTVQHRSHRYVLVGPPVRFVAGADDQPGLFGCI